MKAVTKSVPSGQREFVALSSLLAAGCVMLVFVAAGPWIVRTHGYQVFIPAVATSGLLTIAATQFSAAAPPRTGLAVVLGFALAMRLLLIGEEPFLSTDLYRYIWDGRVQSAGINPYKYVPADPSLAALRDAAIYPRINRADYAVTAYPPVAEMFFFLVTRISETVMAGLTTAYVVIAASIMIWLALRAASRAEPTPREAISDVFLLLAAGLFLMSPNYAWYFLALVPCIPLGAGGPAWALTLGAFLLYKPIYLPHNELIWKTLATVPFLLALMFVLYRRSGALPLVDPISRAEASAAAAVARTSVVIPCLNEEDAIPGVVREVLAQGADEVIVVDNGSTDATAARARDAGARVVSEPIRGYGRACAAGLRAVRPDADIVCFLDGDGSDVPAHFADVVAPVARGEARFRHGVAAAGPSRARQHDAAAGSRSNRCGTLRRARRCANSRTPISISSCGRIFRSRSPKPCGIRRRTRR